MDVGSKLLRVGIVAGAIGFGVTALSLVALDLATGRPAFFTASLLGGILLDGAGHSSTVTIALAPVVAYAALHLAVYLAIGLLGAWLARVAERGSQLWFVGLVVFIIVSFHMIGVVQLLAVPADASIAGTRGWVSGILSGLAMTAYILRSHPNVRRMMSTWEE